MTGSIALVPPPPAGPRLTGKTILVTGAGSGIGAASALRLATEGADVIGVDLNGDGLKATISSLPAEVPGSITAHVADVSEEAQAAAAIDFAVGQAGQLHGLVNLAGILRSAHSADHSLELWDLVIKVNLTGTFLMCRSALPHLIKTRGAIVNAASTSAEFGHPWMAAYSASKSGVVGLTHTLAVEFMKRGVRVNAIAPGGIDTGMTTSVGLPADIDGKLLYRIMPPNGLGSPAAVAGVVAMLVSNDGAFITGELIRVDGGTHA